MPAESLQSSPNAVPGYQPAVTADPLDPFTRWSIDDGTDVTSQSIATIDGIPVGIEEWRFDQFVGESIVVPLDALHGLEDDGMLAGLAERLTIAEDRIAGRERRFFAVHHGFTKL